MITLSILLTAFPVAILVDVATDDGIASLAFPLASLIASLACRVETAAAAAAVW